MSIYINYGTDPARMAEELLERADADSLIRPGFRVTVKPNLVVARFAEGGATTHPEIIEGIIRFLQKRGVRDITIAEGASIGVSTARAYDECGYAALAKKYGVKLVDTKRDMAIAVKNARFEGLKICESAVNTDFLINVPVLKGHCQTRMTCCIKNMKGLIPDSEKRRYHSTGLTEAIAALGAAVRPQLHIIDSICGDLDFEEGGNPVDSNRMLLGFDAVLLDSYCAPLIGYAPDDIGYLRLAREYGAGRYAGPDTPVIELNADKKPRTRRFHSAGAQRYVPMIDDDGACSACYAALVYALRQAGGYPAGKAGPRGARRQEGTAPQKIKIGQGFKGKKAGGIGCGDCASGCERSVGGCPPAALDIVRFLNEITNL